MSDTIDVTRLTLLLNELRLPAIKQIWEQIAARSDKEGWPGARLLATLVEHEIAERDRRRLERHLGEAKLLPGKTLATFDFEAVPMVSKAQVMALCAGDAWLEKGANLILLAPPGNTAVSTNSLPDHVRALLWQRMKLGPFGRTLAVVPAHSTRPNADALVSTLAGAKPGTSNPPPPSCGSLGARCSTKSQCCTGLCSARTGRCWRQAFLQPVLHQQRAVLQRSLHQPQMPVGLRLVPS
jgi:hypothetical protein